MTVYLFMLCMLVFESINTIVAKAMDSTSYHGEVFNHPYFQTGLMFFRETLCLLFNAIYVKATPTAQRLKLLESEIFTDQKFFEKIGKFVFIIPSLFDYISSTLMFLGLSLSTPSVYRCCVVLSSW